MALVIRELTLKVAKDVPDAITPPEGVMISQVSPVVQVAVIT